MSKCSCAKVLLGYACLLSLLLLLVATPTAHPIQHTCALMYVSLRFPSMRAYVNVSVPSMTLVRRETVRQCKRPQTVRRCKRPQTVRRCKRPTLHHYTALAGLLWQPLHILGKYWHHLYRRAYLRDEVVCVHTVAEHHIGQEPVGADCARHYGSSQEHERVDHYRCSSHVCLCGRICAFVRVFWFARRAKPYGSSSSCVCTCQMSL